MTEERCLPRRRDLYANVYNRTKGTLLASRAKVANSFWSRLVGLLGRPSLESGGGVWLIPGNSIHTIGMRFPIDLVLLSRSARVVEVRERVRPYSVVWPKLTARSVLELPEGTVSATRTEIGDEMQIEFAPARASG